MALYGVVAPIQLEQKDIINNGDNAYTLKNKISKLRYEITGDGVNLALDKPVSNLNRISEGWSNPSELEFKHLLLIDSTMAGKTLNIHISGYDTYNQPVAGTQETLTLKVEPLSKEEPVSPPTPENPISPSVPKQPITPASAINPKTGTDMPITALPFLLISIAGTGALLYKWAA